MESKGLEKTFTLRFTMFRMKGPQKTEVFDYEGERCLATLPFCAGRAPSLSTLQQEAARAKGTSGERMMFLGHGSLLK
jgi:hypothetical protein